VKGFQELGEKHHATAGQVTLAWLLAQGDDIIPIPGTKKIKVHPLFISPIPPLKRSNA
jgi:aryl-alcohol dehydrogenase-like predicted oxidoreductase